MRTLHNTVKRGVSAGEPLNLGWKSWEDRKIHLRRGSVAMIAAGPASMKTILALNIVRKLGPQVPVIYHSSDSDDFTMASRTLAMHTRQDTEITERLVMEQSAEAYEALKHYRNVRWSFRTSPDMDFFRREAQAYCTMKGTFPHLTVIDILMNVDHEGVDGQIYWGLMAELNDLAREQQTCVLAIHHTSESAKPDACPPRAAIQGKPTQLPTAVLTLRGDSVEGRLDLACVKNRFGPMDPTGGTYFSMKADPSITRIEELDIQSINEGLLFRDGPATPPDLKLNLFEEI